jgi:hypothetical protein
MLLNSHRGLIDVVADLLYMLVLLHLATTAATPSSAGLLHVVKYTTPRKALRRTS